jgi:hypothetical protein
VLKVRFILSLEKLVGKEKLNEAREAVLKALMSDIRGIVVYKSLEFGRLVKIEGHSIIDLSIGDKGIAEVKILNGNDAAVSFSNSLEAVVEYFLEIVARALNVRRGEVLNAIELVTTPLSEDQVVL